MFWVFNLHCEALSLQFCIWLILSKKYSPVHVRIYPPSSLSSHMIKWPSSFCNHTWSCHYTTPAMFDWWRCMLLIMSSPSPSPHFSLPISLVQVNLDLISPKNLISEQGRLSCLLAKSNPVRTFDKFFFLPNDGLLHLNWHISGTYIGCSKDHLPNAKLTFWINLRSFIVLFVMKWREKRPHF